MGEILAATNVHDAEDSGANAIASETGVITKIRACTTDCSALWQHDIEQASILLMLCASWPQFTGFFSPFCA